MKTLQGWYDSGLTFEQYFTEGDEIDEAAFYSFLDALYPAAIGRRNSFLLGEASRHNRNGEPVYSMFTQRGGSYYYEGETTVKDFYARLKAEEAPA